MDHNPALKAKEYQVKSAEEDISTARAGHYPTLYLSATTAAAAPTVRPPTR
jgi:outer membrane protein